MPPSPPAPPGDPARLDVSIVLYHPDPGVLTAALSSIGAAARVLEDTRGVAARLWLVDNAERPDEGALRALADHATGAGLSAAAILAGHGNVGYGAGHNHAIRRGGGAWHLVLNHDVLLEPRSLVEGIDFMKSHHDVVLVSPRVTNGEGVREYICKGEPTLFDLALRGFAPGFVRRRFARRLARYELRGVTEDGPVFGIRHAGGAFMLLRRDALAALGGFDERFFLYFEDFDLSRRAALLGRVAYAPQVAIVHYGGKAAAKGSRHVRLFAASAWRWFAKHGWRLA